LLNSPPLPTLPNQLFGREPGHSLPPGEGEKMWETSPHPSFLNVSIIPLSVIPECFYQESILFRIKAFGFPIKDFGNDGKGTSFLNVSIRNLYYLE